MQPEPSRGALPLRVASVSMSRFGTVPEPNPLRAYCCAFRNCIEFLHAFKAGPSFPAQVQAVGSGAKLRGLTFVCSCSAFKFELEFEQQRRKRTRDR